MANEELCFLSIAEVSRLIRSREVSPVAVTRAVLERIERLDATIGAYVTVMGDAALEAAREAEREIGDGRHRGPLHGIPVSLKDLIYVKGVRATAGSKVMADFVPDHDATVVEKLRAAGAIVIGKAQSYEFAMGPTTVYHFGRTRNPWDLERVTMGSSSGSAASVSASLCFASIGTDTGGSIRGPAASCGVVGMKPTYGRVSRYGIVPLSWSLDHIGPLARTVMDCALMMNAVAGHDPKDHNSVKAPVPDYTLRLDGEVRGLRVGVPKEFFFDGLDPEFEAPIRRAIELLESEGVTLHQVSLPSVQVAGAIHAAIQLPEAASIHEERLRTRASVFGPTPRMRAETGALVLATDYLKAQRFRTLFQQEFARTMEGVDVMVTPTTPDPPPHFEEKLPINDGRSSTGTAANRFRRPFNMAGAPAITVPCGFTSSGLPVGLQIAGKPMGDEMVLRVAHAYEQRTEWHKRRPPLD